jgi:hypothetical protein
MRVDMFRRPEVSGQFSYLAVPQGRAIPEEAVNTDWEAMLQDVELAAGHAEAIGMEVDDAEQQIGDKGYAITSVTNLRENG